MRVSHFITKMVNGLTERVGLHCAPQAVIYHAFGSIVPTENSGLSARKLRWVVYGRLRFAGKLVSFHLHQFCATMD